MYSHQVLESLQRDLDSPVKKEVSDLIRISQRFHVGESSTVCDMLTYQKGEKLWTGPVLGGCRLPYRVCWFDYWRDKSKVDSENTEKQARQLEGMGVEWGISTKRGYLIKDDLGKGLWVIWSFAYMDERDYWQLIPVRLSLSIRDGSPDVDKGYLYEAAGKSPTESLYSDEVTKKMGHTSMVDLLEINIFLSLLSCKNVIPEEVPSPEKLNKKRRKNGKEPISVYRILKIKPFGASRKVRSLADPTGDLNRLHLCRGHFKVFTDDAPLFGRIIGKYWWQPHVRGSKDRGVVVKDYELEEVA